MTEPLIDHQARRIAVHQILQLMEFWKISLDELTGPMPATWRPRDAVSPNHVKYRHPLTGETWDGQGEHPEWLRKALLKEGYRVEELKPEYQARQQGHALAEADAPPQPAP